MDKTMERITKSCIIPKQCVENFLPLLGDCARPLREKGLLGAGISELYTGYEIGRPNPYHSVVIFVLNGSAQYSTPTTKGTLSEGQCIIFPPHTPYRYWVEEYWKICWFHFQSDSPHDYIVAKDIQIQNHVNCSELLTLATAYYQERLRLNHGNPRASRLLAELLGIHLDRILQTAQSPREIAARAKLDQLWKTVDSQLAHPWSVQELAQRYHLSVPQFRRTVLQYERITPQQKLISLRIERTKQLLIHMDSSLDQIAQLVGYDSPFSLSRIFKKQTGMNPTEYRKRSFIPTPSNNG